jgi:hypothetical protein
MLLFVAAFVFTFLIAEPYPTFTMPGFARVFHTDGDTITFEEPEVVAHWNNGSASMVDYHELLANVQLTGPTAIMKNIFSSSQRNRTSVDTTSASLYQRLKRLRLSMQESLLSDRMNVNRVDDPRTEQWLHQRLGSLFPDSLAKQLQPTSLTVTWQKRSYVLDNMHLRLVDMAVTDSVSVRFLSGEAR